MDAAVREQEALRGQLAGQQGEGGIVEEVILFGRGPVERGAQGHPGLASVRVPDDDLAVVDSELHGVRRSDQDHVGVGGGTAERDACLVGIIVPQGGIKRVSSVCGHLERDAGGRQAASVAAQDFPQAAVIQVGGAHGAAPVPDALDRDFQGSAGRPG